MKKQYTPLAVTLVTKDHDADRVKIVADMAAVMALACVCAGDLRNFYCPHPAITQSSQITRGSAFRK